MVLQILKKKEKHPLYQALFWTYWQTCPSGSESLSELGCWLNWSIFDIIIYRTRSNTSLMIFLLVLIAINFFIMKLLHSHGKITDNHHKLILWSITQCLIPKDTWLLAETRTSNKDELLKYQNRQRKTPHSSHEFPLLLQKRKNIKVTVYQLKHERKTSLTTNLCTKVCWACS